MMFCAYKFLCTVCHLQSSETNPMLVVFTFIGLYDSPVGKKKYGYKGAFMFVIVLHRNDSWVISFMLVLNSCNNIVLGQQIQIFHIMNAAWCLFYHVWFSNTY